MLTKWERLKLGQCRRAAIAHWHGPNPFVCNPLFVPDAQLTLIMIFPHQTRLSTAGPSQQDADIIARNSVLAIYAYTLICVEANGRQGLCSDGAANHNILRVAQRSTTFDNHAPDGQVRLLECADELQRAAGQLPHRARHACRRAEQEDARVGAAALERHVRHLQVRWHTPLRALAAASRCSDHCDAAEIRSGIRCTVASMRHEGALSASVLTALVFAALEASTS